MTRRTATCADTKFSSACFQYERDVAQSMLKLSTLSTPNRSRTFGLTPLASTVRANNLLDVGAWGPSLWGIFSPRSPTQHSGTTFYGHSQPALLPPCQKRWSPGPPADHWNPAWPPNCVAPLGFRDFTFVKKRKVCFNRKKSLKISENLWKNAKVSFGLNKTTFSYSGEISENLWKSLEIKKNLNPRDFPEPISAMKPQISPTEIMAKCL